MTPPRGGRKVLPGSRLRFDPTSSEESRGALSRSEPRSPSASRPLRVGFLLSGSGRTLENLALFLRERPDLAQIVTVVSSRDGAGGLERAARFGIPATVIPCPRPESSSRIFEHLEEHRVDYALLGGWLRLLEIPPSWDRRVVNIHPSLLPRHGGAGYYGSRVHEAVLAAGDKESGCTVHFVDNEYDHGEAILQEVVPVEADDSVESLAARVFEAECRAYPRALEVLAARRRDLTDG